MPKKRENLGIPPFFSSIYSHDRSFFEKREFSARTKGLVIFSCLRSQYYISDVERSQREAASHVMEWLFYVVNEGIKVGTDVGCQVLQRGVARNTLLGYQTTLSTAAQRFAARDVNVTHTESVTGVRLKGTVALETDAFRFTCVRQPWWLKLVHHFALTTNSINNV